MNKIYKTTQLQETSFITQKQAYHKEIYLANQKLSYLTIKTLRDKVVNEIYNQNKLKKL